MPPMQPKYTQKSTNTYLKIIFLTVIVLGVLLICIATVNATEALDYSGHVREIINDKSLSPMEKNTHQAELFGWNTKIASYLDRITLNEDMEIDDLEMHSESTIKEPDLITKTLYFFGIVEEPLTDEEGSAAYDAYLINYMTNYKGSYTVTGGTQ